MVIKKAMILLLFYEYYLAYWIGNFTMLVFHQACVKIQKNKYKSKPRLAGATFWTTFLFLSDFACPYFLFIFQDSEFHNVFMTSVLQYQHTWPTFLYRLPKQKPCSWLVITMSDWFFFTKQPRKKFLPRTHHVLDSLI